MEYTQAECDKIWWWHAQSFPNGVRSKGHHDPSAFVQQMRLPDLTAKTVIDIGAWDGYFGFECERRGAQVTAADRHIWLEGPTGKQGFDFAKGALGSNVEDIVVDVLDLDKLERQFDVALFLGVLYHMRHPLLSLEKLASVTRDLAIIETHIDCLNEKRPVMAFYEGREVGNDPSNWFGPNPAAVCAMARAAGFASAEVVSQTGRLVVHARK